MRKTKIICTIGPATSKTEKLINLIESGMDCARLNFSHGSHEEHRQTINNIREAEKITGKPLAILQDLQGPKIRTNKLENGEVLLEGGTEFIITTEDFGLGNSKKVSTSYENLPKELSSGNTILLDDGYIILKVKKITGSNIITEVVKGGILKNNKGIVSPGVSSMAPSLNEKDLADLRFGLKSGIDSVALSFVRSVRDILELQTAMKIYGRSVPIISKIERTEAYDNIDAIIKESESIMVARGDLGLEMPAEDVPVVQKEIVVDGVTYVRKEIEE